MNAVPTGQPQPLYHVCFSGSPVCSGCTPCEACAAEVHARVLPQAMIAAGANGALLAAAHVLADYIVRHLRVDPGAIVMQAIGVPLDQVMFASPEEQMNACFRGYVDGFRKLVSDMNGDPETRSRLKYRAIDEAPTGGPQGRTAEPEPRASDESPDEDPSDRRAEPAVLGSVMGEGFVPKRRRAAHKRPSAPREPPSVEEVEEQLPPMTAAEIVMAASPVEAEEHALNGIDAAADHAEVADHPNSG